MPVLSFDNIVVTVPDVKGPKRYLPAMFQDPNARKEVLHNITGRFPRKGLVAIMGPSGSGKTTFLNAISNRMSIGGASGVKCSGVVKVNGEVVPPDYFYSKSVSFVPQDTCLFSELTPRESIRFSTQMIFPHLPPEDVERKVSATLASLSLTKCADTQIGNEMFRGVSGGERKRTSIGVAIVNDPEVLFLDEPTTGLDTETADMVVRSITGLSKRTNNLCLETEDGVSVQGQPSASRSMASGDDEEGRIIIMTLHQPSSTTWSYLSHLVLLVQGYIVYNGPASEAMDFFVSVGFRRPINANPADHFLDVVQCQEDDEDLDIATLAQRDGEEKQPLIAPKTNDKRARAKYLAGAWKHHEKQLARLTSTAAASAALTTAADNSTASTRAAAAAARAQRERLQQAMAQYAERRGDAVDEEEDAVDFDIVQSGGVQVEAGAWAGKSPLARFAHELKVLTARSWTTFRRQKLMLPLKLMQVFITAILMICLFSPFGNYQVSVLNRSGCMYLLIIIQIFASVLSVVMLFPEERGVYLTEQAARLYTVLPYFTSKLIIDIPVLSLTMFAFSVLVYFPIGFQPAFSKFILFFLVIEAVAIAGHGMGLIVASVVSSPAMAALVAPMVISPFILFSRVAIPGDPDEKITPIMRPLQIFSPFFWGLDALMAVEFKGLRMQCADEEVYAVPSIKYGILYICRFEHGEEVLENYMISQDNYPLSFFMLCLIAVLAIGGSAVLLKVLSLRVASSVPMEPPSKKQRLREEQRAAAQQSGELQMAETPYSR